MLELGASCKKARETQNLSIETIAADTRISSRFLLAIESEQFEILPGGIFNRGFIRTYTERLGIDPDEALRAYESVARVVETEVPRPEAHHVGEKVPRIPIYYAALGVLLLLVVGFYIWTRPSEPSHVTAVAAAPASAPAPEPVVPDSKEPETAEATALSAAGPVTAVASAVVPPVPPPSTAAAPANGTATGPIVMELEVREDSWFQLSSDGNAVVAGEVLTAGTVRRYTASASMDVSFGNAAGVNMKLNGQRVSSLGRSGQVRRINITPSTSAASLAVKAAE